MSIRDSIAQRFFEAEFPRATWKAGHVGDQDEWAYQNAYSRADQLLESDAVRQLRAEALREAADWKREHNLGHGIWGEYLTELAREKYQAGGDDMITIWLNDRADRVEKGE